MKVSVIESQTYLPSRSKWCLFKVLVQFHVGLFQGAELRPRQTYCVKTRYLYPASPQAPLWTSWIKSAEAEVPVPRNKPTWTQLYRTQSRHRHLTAPGCPGKQAIHQSLGGGASSGAGTSQRPRHTTGNKTGKLQLANTAQADPQSVKHNGGKKWEGNSGKMRNVACMGKKKNEIYTKKVLSIKYLYEYIYIYT